MTNTGTRFSLLVAFLILFAACSGSKTINSIHVDQPPVIDASSSDWPSKAMNRELTQDFDLAFTNDDEFFYLHVRFRNNSVWRMARDFGMRIYFDGDTGLRRSFGIVYPAGIVNALADIPGARKDYLTNPGWENMSENRRLITRIENDQPDRVLIISRTSSDQSIRPFQISKDQLRANSIEVSMSDDTRLRQLEIKVPIHISRNRDFAVQPDNNGRFRLGFEIIPPEYQEVTGEPVAYESRESASAREYGNRRPQQGQELAVSHPQLYHRLNDAYRNWFNVRIRKSE